MDEDDEDNPICSTIKCFIKVISWWKDPTLLNLVTTAEC